MDRYFDVGVDEEGLGKWEERGFGTDKMDKEG